MYSKNLGVDEKSFTRGHRYFTLVNDLDRGRVLFVAEKREESLPTPGSSVSVSVYNQEGGLKSKPLVPHAAGVDEANDVKPAREDVPGFEPRVRQAAEDRPFQEARHRVVLREQPVHLRPQRRISAANVVEKGLPALQAEVDGLLEDLLRFGGRFRFQCPDP